MLALLGERIGNALRGFVDLLPDQFADRRQVLRQINVHIVDGRTHLLGLADQRIALAGEILNEVADAHFVVAIAAAERCDLVMHHAFQFAGARQRALDAVPMAATSRRIAWPTLTMESRATLSGSASRMATPAIDWAISRSSWARHAMWATPKKKMIGSNAAALSPTTIAAIEWPGPMAAVRSERKAHDKARQPTIQAAENTAATK